MHADSVVNAIRREFTRRVVGSDDQGLVSGPAQMFQDAQH